MSDNVNEEFLIGTTAGAVSADFYERLGHVGVDYKSVQNDNYLASYESEATQAGMSPSDATLYTNIFFAGTDTLPHPWPALHLLKNPLPNTWEGYINKWRTEYLLETLNVSALPSNTDEGPLWDQFFGSYAQAVKTMLSPVSGDLAILNGSDTLITEAVLKSQFKNAFSNFLTNYPYESDGSLGNFHEKWQQYIGTIAYLQNATSTSKIPTYEEQFYGHFPGGTQAEFENLLQKFYQEQLTENSPTGDPADGFFLPSQSYNDWVKFVQHSYQASLFESYLSAKGVLNEAGFDKVQILERILRLLIDMIDSMQAVATVQAERLNFLTDWQRAYTQDMGSMTEMIQTSSSTIGDYKASTDDQENIDRRENRNTLNTQLGTEQETLRQNRSQVSDTAKAEQSNINQSNDAVNQQTNMATSILQMFSTLLGAIFR